VDAPPLAAASVADVHAAAPSAARGCLLLSLGMAMATACLPKALRDASRLLPRTWVVAAFLAACTPGDDAPAPAAEGGGGAGGAFAESICAGGSYSVCPEGEYCTHEECSPGSLVAFPCATVSSCHAENWPVCGCDGEVYADACEAREATRLNRCYGGKCPLAPITSSCATPDGYFRCGLVFCRLGAESCDHSGCFSKWHTFACVPMVPACAANPTCPCVEQHVPSAICSEDDLGGVTLSRWGGPDGC
jgi:hypothetical protein